MRINSQIQGKKILGPSQFAILHCVKPQNPAHFLADVDLWQIHQILFRGLIHGSSAVVGLETDPKFQLCECCSLIKFANQVQVPGVETQGQAMKMPRMSLFQPRRKSCAIFKYEILVFRGLFCRMKRGIRFLCSVIRKKKMHVSEKCIHIFIFHLCLKRINENKCLVQTLQMINYFGYLSSKHREHSSAANYPSVSGTNKIST